MSKYKDWSGWWDGLRSKALQAGAESAVTNITAWLGSNGIAASVPALHDMVLNWKTAIFMAGVQFTLRTALAAFMYIQAKPTPDFVEIVTKTEVTTTEQTTETKEKDPL